MKIFVSYPSEQRVHAREVFELLRKFGIDAWFDRVSLIAGQDWNRARTEAQQEADMTVLICSEETTGRAGVIQREIKDILDILSDKPLGEIFLIPLRVGNVRLPPELAKYQYIDKTDPDWKLDLANSIKFKASQSGLSLTPELEEFIAGSTLLGSRELKKIGYEDNSMKLEAEYMTYLNTGTYWEFVNSKISEFVLREFYRHQRELTPLDEMQQVKNWWIMRVEEFFRVEDLVSLRLFEEVYGGGAHPNRRTHTLNFCGAPFDAFSLRDLLQQDLEGLTFIREYCETDIKRQFLPDKWEQWPLPTEEGRLWDEFSDFNFDSRSA
jgi:hypothetical protein